jgi:hypothetical protein
MPRKKRRTNSQDDDLWPEWPEDKQSTGQQKHQGKVVDDMSVWPEWPTQELKPLRLRPPASAVKNAARKSDFEEW